jgi:hypothetical protein
MSQGMGQPMHAPGKEVRGVLVIDERHLFESTTVVPMTDLHIWADHPQMTAVRLDAAIRRHSGYRIRSQSFRCRLLAPEMHLVHPRLLEGGRKIDRMPYATSDQVKRCQDVVSGHFGTGRWLMQLSYTP